MKKEKHPIKKLYYRFCRGQYTINGTMNGNIEHSNVVMVGATGIVNGNVHAKYANIDGTIHGDLSADDYIELSPTANITGKVYAKEILTKGAEGPVTGQTIK